MSDKERYREYSNPKKRELKGKMDLAAQRLVESARKWRTIKDPNIRQIAREIGETHAYNGRVKTDQYWVIAFQELGIPEELAMKVWEKKDELASMFKQAAQDLKDQIDRKKGKPEP